ncbi:MAG: hypothetical protein FJY73_11075, partial [Candidatus Eisenbacteria bacterium]|nr:hypothetical protein [Candidatus Eisenbacteria bacterium]
DAGRALASYQQSLEIAQRLYEQNPNDAQAARDLSVSFFKLFQVEQQVGNEPAALGHLRSCHRMLREMERAGQFMDPPLRNLLDQLDRALAPEE